MPESDAAQSLDVDALALRTQLADQIAQADLLGEENEPTELAAGHEIPTIELARSEADAPSADHPTHFDSSCATWHVRLPSGEQFGPAENDVFQQWLAENRVSADSHVWRDGWPDWLFATEAFPASFPNAASHDEPKTGMERASSQETDSGGWASLNAVAPTLGDRNRIDRKQRRKRNHMILLSILSVLAFVLIAALVTVLVMQP